MVFILKKNVSHHFVILIHAVPFSSEQGKDVKNASTLYTCADHMKSQLFIQSLRVAVSKGTVCHTEKLAFWAP